MNATSLRETIQWNVALNLFIQRRSHEGQSRILLRVASFSNSSGFMLLCKI